MESNVSREGQIVEAFQWLRESHQNLHEISERDLAARTALKRKESELLLSGAIIGKNAETRDAQLKEATKEECQTCEDLRQLKGEAQLRMDLANMKVQELMWLVRNDQAISDLGAGR
jgi:hypothetical protein